MAWHIPLYIERANMILMGSVLTCLVVTEVIFRYFLQQPQLWVEEVILYTVLWYYLLGTALTTYDRSHIVGGVIHLFFSPRIADRFRVGTDFASFSLSCLFTYWSYQVFLWNLDNDPRTMQLNLPDAYAYLALLVGFTFVTMYFLSVFINRVRETLSTHTPKNVVMEGRQ
ncbi:TRAP transporter small permease [Chloroflexota bacterium]